MSPTTVPDPLTQLEGYLAQDPANDGLRAEAFETALRTGRRERAEAHLTAGVGAGADPLGWQLRQAHWQMAERDWPAAARTLGELLAAAASIPALDSAVRCDLALIALRTGRPAEGLAWLATLVEGAAPAPQPAVQALWLRLKHHADLLDDALADAGRWDQSQALGAEAAGVASLAALDAGDLPRCDAWSRRAVAELPQSMEALVSQGSLALARQAPQDARQWLQRALQVNPADGRAWSGLAFADMLAGDLAAARGHFERALRLMPEHIGTWHGLGWAALFLGDLSAARAAFEQALELDRNFGESHGAMAAVHTRAGERQAAEAAIEIALRLDRACMAAHYARAVLDGRADDAGELQRVAARLLAAKRANSGLIG